MALPLSESYGQYCHKRIEFVYQGRKLICELTYAPFFHTSFYVIFSTSFYTNASDAPLSTMMAPSALSLITNLLRNAAFTIVFSFHSALLLRLNGENHQSTHGVFSFSVAQPLLLTMLTFPCTTSTYTLFLRYAASTIILSA